ETAPHGAALQVGVGSDSLVIPLEGLIDVEAEKARLAKALAASEKEAKSLEGRLSNPNFVERAKPEAVEKARADHAHHAAETERLKSALARLGCQSSPLLPWRVSRGGGAAPASLANRTVLALRAPPPNPLL